MADRNYIIKDGVQATDHVLMTIAGIAACEVEGVASLNGGLTHENVSRVSRNRISHAVRIMQNDDGSLTAQVIIVVKYGYTIVDVSMQVQDKVKASLENMTDLTVRDVDVKIMDVAVQE